MAVGTCGIAIIHSRAVAGVAFSRTIPAGSRRRTHIILDTVLLRKDLEAKNHSRLWRKSYLYSGRRTGSTCTWRRWRVPGMASLLGADHSRRFVDRAMVSSAFHQLVQTADCGALVCHKQAHGLCF